MRRIDPDKALIQLHQAQSNFLCFFPARIPPNERPARNFHRDPGALRTFCLGRPAESSPAAEHETATVPLPSHVSPRLCRPACVAPRRRACVAPPVSPRVALALTSFFSKKKSKPASWCGERCVTCGEM